MPVVVTVNVPGLPTTKVAPFALVMAAGWPMVSVNDWTLFGRIPFEAVTVSG